jgi:hypothetical protein
LILTLGTKYLDIFTFSYFANKSLKKSLWFSNGKLLTSMVQLAVITMYKYKELKQKIETLKNIVESK